MATQTKNLWSALDATTDTRATISFTWDDVSLRILAFIFTNPTSKVLTFSATSTSNGKNYSGAIPANTAESIITINNQNAQNRLNVTVTPNGRLDGVEYNIDF